MKYYEFELPVRGVVERKTKPNKIVPLTQNWYRNAHHQVSNKVKKAYAPYSYDHPFRAKRIRIHYIFTARDNKITDAPNWIGVAEKFFLDWLKNNGYIDDDGLDIYVGGSWEAGRDLSLKEHRIIARVIVEEYKNKQKEFDKTG